MDPEKKKLLLQRVSEEMDKNEELIEDIEKGRWESFYNTLKKICADIWDSIKDCASKIWHWVTDLFS